MRHATPLQLPFALDHPPETGVRVFDGAAPVAK
jgi:hypothetical protein